MSNSFQTSKSDDVQRLLNIASSHLKYIERSRTKEITAPGVKPDHAIVASIFSAAAVETGLNLFISIPALYSSDSQTREFIGALVIKHMRMSIRGKIKFVCEINKKLQKNKILIKKIHDLFNYRNQLLHSAPEYYEQNATKESN